MGLLSGLTGGLFGTTKGTTTTTQKSEPWAAAQPYMKDIFSLGQNLYNQNFTSPYTTQAQGLIANRATSGNPLMPAAQNQALNTINGNYLDPYSNPYFGGALTDTLGQVKSQINSGFTGDNYGNSAHQEWLGRGLTNAAMPMLANFYNTERGNQMNAIGMAPALANQDYTDLEKLQGLGQTQEDDPWKDLMRYQSAISGFGNLGGTTTTEQPYFQNNTANTIGSAANLAVIGKMLGLFSDRRLKKDVEKIGEHPKGFGVYRFKYLWEDQNRIGVMADEVEKVIPEAVFEVSGYKAVDYGRL